MDISEKIVFAPTVGQIVANNFQTADVFKKYNIDFCCKGNKLLADVCREKGLEQITIEEELQQCVEKGNSIPLADITNMRLDDLSSYIELTHHAYVRENIPALTAYLTKINKVHGTNHPELQEILTLFTGCAEDLTNHMAKEERILFPAIKKIAQAHKANETVNAPFFFGTLSFPIDNMENEHAIEGERAARIAQLSNNFTPPADACTTYKVAYQKLEAFFNDLYTHIHLENNVLFPRAIALERLVMKLEQN